MSIIQSLTLHASHIPPHLRYFHFSSWFNPSDKEDRLHDIEAYTTNSLITLIEEKPLRCFAKLMKYCMLTRYTLLAVHSWRVSAAQANHLLISFQSRDLYFIYMSITSIRFVSFTDAVLFKWISDIVSITYT